MKELILVQKMLQAEGTFKMQKVGRGKQKLGD